MPNLVAFSLSGSTIAGTYQAGNVVYATASAITSGSFGLIWGQEAVNNGGYMFITDSYTQSFGGTTVSSATPLFYPTNTLLTADVLNEANKLPDRRNQTPFVDVASALSWLCASGKYVILQTGSLYSCAAAPVVGSGSINFNATSWFTVPGTSSWAVGTGDFTVEWFQYQTNNGNENFIFDLGTGNTFAATVDNGGKKLNVYMNGAAVSNPAVTNQLNVWHYFAISRTGSTMNVYFDGTRVDTFTNTSNITDSSSTLYIGTKDGAGGSGDNWPGYISNFRWTKGQCLYNTATITVPTANLTVGSFTKLLLLAQTAATLTTDSTGLNTVTNVGATWIASAPF